MNLSSAKEIIIPEGSVKKILIDNVVLWEEPATYKNWARFSTEVDGVTIYNGGIGYKIGYRVRSDGAEVAVSEMPASCTGFIPLKAGDVVRLSGYDALKAQATNAINVSNSNKENLGQAIANSSGGYGIFAQSAYLAYNWPSVVENPTGIYTWVCPPHPDIAFMRVTGFTQHGETMIITVNEEIV